MNVYGYELLYRSGHNDFYDGSDDSQTTASVIDASFLLTGFDQLIGKGKGFINFSQQFLQEEVPLLLPKERVVVEVLEHVRATDGVRNACRKLRDAGYTLALDDFPAGDENSPTYQLIDLAGIIKIEFNEVPKPAQLDLMRRYGDKVTFLAEKVETAEQYKQAVEMGYSLFQGYFFSHPCLIGAKNIGTLDANLLGILRELKSEEPDMEKVAGIIESDVGLSYKLLRMANSVYYGKKTPAKSIQEAVVYLGVQEMLQWVNLMILSGIQNPENAELVRTCVIRGKMLQMIARQPLHRASPSSYFITGIFSSLDQLLNEEMEKILLRLPLDSAVKDALLGKDNEIRRALDAVLAFERADWSIMDILLKRAHISREYLMEFYFGALKWQQAL